MNPPSPYVFRHLGDPAVTVHTGSILRIRFVEDPNLKLRLADRDVSWYRLLLISQALSNICTRFRYSMMQPDHQLRFEKLTLFIDSLSHPPFFATIASRQEGFPSMLLSPSVPFFDLWPSISSFDPR
jgi:hypothetical protein